MRTSRAGLALRSSPGRDSFIAGTSLAPAQKAKATFTRHASSSPVQASLLGRASRVARSYIFFFGNSTVGELEDPRRMLDQAVTDMREDVTKMRQAAAQVYAAERQMETRFASAQAASDEWKRRAEWALRKGDEDLAREALKRRKTFETTANTMREQLEQHRKASATLKANISALESKVAEALNKKETLKARAASAQATKMLNEEISSLVGGLRSSSNSSLSAFARMEQKVEALEAEADAAGQMGMFGDALGAKFALMEAGTVEDDLLKLKTDLLNIDESIAKLPSQTQAWESIPNFQRKPNSVDIVWP
ncbi:g12632 [Coccomyxa viridis]|uniref:G12632 protein n=1 Tax=Coccomyxa viridis TaxID=1274662 RepID=A0ABP1GAT1_9CHLO